MCTNSDTDQKLIECVLVQMLSARYGVLSHNRSSNNLFQTIHMRSFCCGSLGFLSSVPVELRLNHFAFVNILCSFIVMIPLGLRKSIVLALYTLQFVYL